MGVVRPKTFFCRLKIYWSSQSSQTIGIYINANDKKKIENMEPLSCKFKNGNTICLNLRLAESVEILQSEEVHYE